MYRGNIQYDMQQTTCIFYQSIMQLLYEYRKYSIENQFGFNMHSNFHTFTYFFIDGASKTDNE